MTLKMVSAPFFVVLFAVLSSCTSNELGRGAEAVFGTDTLQVADTFVGSLDTVSGMDVVVV